MIQQTTILMRSLPFYFLIFLFVLLDRSLWAHDGRRLEIKVVNDKLWAQGYIGGDTDDGGGFTRPYRNAIHDHWVNAAGAKQEAVATLPVWDLIETEPLLGYSVALELVDAYKWVDPPLMPPPGTIPDFEALDPVDDFVTIDHLFGQINTNTLGGFELIEQVDVHGHLDLHADYFIEREPSQEIFVFEWVLSTDAPGIKSSESIFVVMSPDGSTPEERLHHASLFTEQYLGISVPEPSSMLCVVGLLFVFNRRRRLD